MPFCSPNNFSMHILLSISVEAKHGDPACFITPSRATAFNGADVFSLFDVCQSKWTINAKYKH